MYLKSFHKTYIFERIHNYVETKILIWIYYIINY